MRKLILSAVLGLLLSSSCYIGTQPPKQTWEDIVGDLIGVRDDFAQRQPR